MEKLITFEEKYIIYRLLIEEKTREEKELEGVFEMMKKNKKLFDLSIVAYKKGYILKLEKIIDKLFQ